MTGRLDRIVDCNPRWISGRYTGVDIDIARGVHFDCPEGHAGCSHAIPFSPALDGSPSAGWQQNGAIWQRTGDTFETLTLQPSIRRIPTYASREAAVAGGARMDLLGDAHFCAFHGFITAGAITFCGDSR
jgi:hypothetical protein